jgi:hypothetical protein
MTGPIYLAATTSSLLNSLGVTRLSGQEVHALVAQVFARSKDLPVDEADALWVDEPAVEFEEIPKAAGSTGPLYACDVAILRTPGDINNLGNLLEAALQSMGYQVMQLIIYPQYLEEESDRLFRMGPIGQVSLVVSGLSVVGRWDLWKAIFPMLLTEEDTVSIVRSADSDIISIQRRKWNEINPWDERRRSADVEDIRPAPVAQAANPPHDFIPN